jgi:hypothetical protein
MPFQQSWEGNFVCERGKQACLSEQMKMIGTAEGGKGHCSSSKSKFELSEDNPVLGTNKKVLQEVREIFITFLTLR